MKISMSIGPLVVAGFLLAGCAAVPDAIYRNGYVYTVDAHDSVQQALAVRDGRILDVGSNQRIDALAGPSTRVIDLHGRMVMPGLIDAHLHPIDGGDSLMGCDLKYAELTVAQFQQTIQACLDADAARHKNGWLEVTNWMRQAMLPKGVDASAATLDGLRTDRPIFVQSTDFHTVLANSRAMQLAGVTRATPDPHGGSIARTVQGEPSGIFEDEAGNLIVSAKPVHTPAEVIGSAGLALKLLGSQGVTTFFNALADEDQLKAFRAVQQSGHLTARAFFAPMITTDMAGNPEQAVAYLKNLASQFDQGPVKPEPGIVVRHAKLFMDGVMQPPAYTAGLLEPYLINQGSAAHRNYVVSANRGPVYLPPQVLDPLLVSVAKAGFSPHIHAVGDRAVREALDAISVMRKQVGDPLIRPAIAHDEMVDPLDYPRFAQLDVTPVMSFQWATPVMDSMENPLDYIGAQRFARMEPEGSLYQAGARIAFGSDWPVDPLNEWFALKVGITRTGAPDAAHPNWVPLNAEIGLPRQVAIRSATMNAAYTLNMENQIGSLEVGKMADLIILDRNFFSVDAEQIADIKVLTTVVGGKTIYSAEEPKTTATENVAR